MRMASVEEIGECSSPYCKKRATHIVFDRHSYFLGIYCMTHAEEKAEKEDREEAIRDERYKTDIASDE